MKREILLLMLAITFVNTYAQTKKITWLSWKNTPVNVKNQLKTIKMFENETVYSSILEAIKEGDKAFIAVIDIDGDGKPGYAVAYSGSFNCGTAGCSFAVYEAGGKMRVELVDHWELIRPAKNGIISSTGKFFPLQPFN
ncbi:MAG: hypothetical protein EOO89_07560 [Pedobacter sp.]|nr:MAG: hypothetical protein EOO89_07560 [Pedobacter sp.]